MYLVATPIGHPDDISVRALTILRAVPLITAEDTRVTAELCRRHGLTAPLVSYHDHNESARIDGLIRHLQTNDLAVVSDAGSPSVSDPGFPLVRACIDAGIPVHVVPGPCAAIAALTGSGLATDRFHFIGFLPVKSGDREASLAAAAAWPGTLVVYESPKRLSALLEWVADRWPTRRIAVARNLTKPFEQWLRGTAAEVRSALGEEDRGEVVVAIEGASEPTMDDEAVDREICRLLAEGHPSRNIRDQVAARSGRPRRDIYARVLALRG